MKINIIDQIKMLEGEPGLYVIEMQIAQRKPVTLKVLIA